MTHTKVGTFNRWNLQKLEICWKALGLAAGLASKVPGPKQGHNSPGQRACLAATVSKCLEPTSHHSASCHVRTYLTSVLSRPFRVFFATDLPAFAFRSRAEGGPFWPQLDKASALFPWRTPERYSGAQASDHAQFLSSSLLSASWTARHGAAATAFCTFDVVLWAHVRVRCTHVARACVGVQVCM